MMKKELEWKEICAKRENCFEISSSECDGHFYTIHLYLVEFEGILGITESVFVLWMKKARWRSHYLPKITELFLLG